MTKWLRWKIAVLLNRLPDTCWAELVMWAEFPENHEFMEVFSLRHSAGHCERMEDTPYCGKCGGGITNDNHHRYHLQRVWMPNSE